MEKTIQSKRGEKRSLEEQDSMRILMELKADENYETAFPDSLSSSDDEEHPGVEATQPSPDQSTAPNLSVQELKKSIAEEERAEGAAVVTGEITSVENLKYTLQVDQKHRSEQKDSQSGDSSHSSSDSDDEEKQTAREFPHMPDKNMDLANLEPGFPQPPKEIAPLDRNPAEEVPKDEPAKFDESGNGALEEEKSEVPEAPAAVPMVPIPGSEHPQPSVTPVLPTQETKSTMMSNSPSRRMMLASELEAAGEEALIFKTAPMIANIEVEYTIDAFKVGHVSFLLDMRYEEQRWKVLCHRQNLIEFHTNLKSIRLQNQVRNKIFFWKRNGNSQEEELIESMMDHPDSSIRRMSSTKRMSAVQNKKETLEDTIKDIHFPRGLIMSDRPHFFHKGAALSESSNVRSQEILTNLKTSVLHYLTKVLESKLVRNLACTLELFRCSSLSFDKALGPSVIEGWVKFQKHSPSLGAVTWHTCRTGCLVCNCACVPISNSKRLQAWIVVKESFAVFLKKPLDPTPLFILLFDTGFDILKGFSTTGRKKHIFLHSNTTVADLTFRSRNEKKLWAHHLKFETTSMSWHCRDHPHGSFAPEREDRCFAKYIVDGADYFAAVANALEEAESEIFISGWWVTPDVILKRGTPEGNEYWTLRSVLKRKAEQGVKVYVLMFKEVEVAIALNSKFQESRLKAPNIYVLRHPNFSLGGTWYWSHHEKLVVCDSAVAFAGGLDLCWGRYDDASHSLVDNPLVNMWPGLDYYNPRIQDIPDPRHVDRDILDRDTDPRMPWHDVSCEVSGPPARDLARHFVHQWNYALISKSGSRTDLPLLIPKDFPSFPNPREDHFKVKTQILRSLASWSGGPEGKEEMSIQDAYISAIADAQKYIYIENQFFISGLQGDSLVLNRIADALYQRISRAAAERKEFRVVVFLPLLPAFEGAVDDSGQAALRQVLFWQYRTMCRGENRRSLWQALEDNPDVQDPSKYLSFFALRTFDKSQASANDENPKIFTEMVYIHSKIMIIDDHVAFIGSANLNDRSMSGKRDSELCIKFMDTTFIADVKLRGEPWPLAGKFARGLRMRLFEEHFGQALPTEVLEDFVLPENFERMRSLARQNTELYEKVFNLVPSDRILTFGDLKRNGNRGSRPPALGTMDRNPEPTADANPEPTEEDEEDEDFSESIGVRTARTESTGESLKNADFGSKLKRLQSFSSLDKTAPGESFKEKVAYLNGVYGHVVEFPLKFLSRARKLKPTATVISDQIFT